ncbi:uncharacterized protein Z520_11355 [Fonsecaea multimorphosa CBS 102226]|uniref:FAD-binding domain-containing protein n=1 Tax=Fonsecaea multimorphosa CBS 102226 TaxID=1442371 RepID=A0A0D2JQY7_9EURO|nr:uncharacterized protein Z520_11355 [Fonsecaea multimorphosa CBS 102226]KIX92879.1 hypothetical protein Z520_11355 [Fonsecaea multimorphosa CBS 102226]OAL18128.1 hypothetical protein AYO22_10905 [Fonsecaea multimorphosa]
MPSKGSSDLLAGKTILVSGGGIAGLTFAVAIAKLFPEESLSPARPQIIIYERDSYEDRIGREGYTLSLRTDNNPGAVQVLDSLGLYELVRSVSVNSEGLPEARGSFNLWDPQFRPFLRFVIQPVGPKKLVGMRIRRNALQRVLAEAAIASGAQIQWETAVMGAEPTEDGRVRVNLSTGLTTVGDILLAADGSRSKLRSLLRPNDGLNYAGVYLWSGIAKFASHDDIPKPLDRDWGGVLGAKGVGLFVSPVDDKSALWAFSRPSPVMKESLKYPIPQERLDELLEESMELAANFAPLVKSLISATDPSTIMQFNAMDRPPFPHQSVGHAPVIWIGDANHAVSPFAGNGANMAIMDAWDLANSLNKASTLEEAVTAYDKVAVPRASRVLKSSHWAIDCLHATGVKLLIYKVMLLVLGFLTRSGRSRD